jgi:hypothetical protein
MWLALCADTSCAASLTLSRLFYPIAEVNTEMAEDQNQKVEGGSGQTEHETLLNVSRTPTNYNVSIARTILNSLKDLFRKGE